MPTRGKDEREALAYFAGVFDGEGYFTVRELRSRHALDAGRSRGPVHTAVAGINITDRPTVERFHERFGGTLFRHPRTYPNRKQIWCWNVSRRKAVGFIESVRPWLRIKGGQADLLLELQSLMRHDWGVRGIPADNVARRVAIREQVQRLNGTFERLSARRD